MLKISVEKAVNRDGYNIWVINELEDALFSIAKPLLLEFGEPKGGYSERPEPTLFLRSMEFRQLLKSVPEELSDQGIIARPNFASGELQATKESNAFNRDVIKTLLHIVQKSSV